MPEIDATPDDVHLIDSAGALKVICDPLRRRIMRSMVDQPRSVQYIAQAVGVPFTRLYYHIKLLDKHGLIRHVGTQQHAGAIEEKFYMIRAYRFEVDPALTAFSGDDAESAHKPANETANRRLLHYNFAALERYADDPAIILLQRRIAALPENRLMDFQQRLLAMLAEFEGQGAESEDYVLAVALYRPPETP